MLSVYRDRDGAEGVMSGGRTRRQMGRRCLCSSVRSGTHDWMYFATAIATVGNSAAQLIEAGRSTGRKKEAGPSNPRMSTLAGLAGVLGITVTELLGASRI